MSNASKPKKPTAGKPSTTGQKSGKGRDDAGQKHQVVPKPNRLPPKLTKK